MAIFDKLKLKWESDLDACRLLLSSLGKAQSSYFELGVTLLELGSNCHTRFEKATPKEKREILKSLCSNCKLENGSVLLSLQEPFKTMLQATESEGDKREIGKWLPVLDAIRTSVAASRTVIANSRPSVEGDKVRGSSERRRCFLPH
jgi:hypothetical protein